MNSSTSISRHSQLAWWLLPLLAVLLLPTYNWVQDYYGIFGQRSDWRGVIPNERYRKLEAVMERPETVTALLFGSSKAANIPFARTLGEGAYNFAYSEGLPRDHLEVLEYLVGRLPALERVYIAVDEMAYLLDPSRHADDYLRRQHPAVADIPGWQFQLRYLFRPLSNTDALYFTPDRLERPQITYDFETTGRSLCPSCDAEIEADPEVHRQQAFFRFPYNPPDQYGLDRLRTDLEAILDLLAEHGVEPVLFLQPTFANNLRWHNLGKLEALKSMLAELRPFHDFLVYEPALADTDNFYDVIHFRPPVGQRIMNSLADSAQAAPGSFGFRVTATSLAEHNAAVREQLLGSLVPPQRYRQDRQYSDWLRDNGFQRGPLAAELTAEVLAATPAPLDCRLDTVNRARFGDAPVRIAVDDLGVLEFGGWAPLQAMAPTAYLSVREQGPFGRARVYPLAAGLPRPDVAKRFGEAYQQVGFRANLDISNLDRGNYQLDLRFRGAGDEWSGCDDAFRLVVF